MFNAFSAVIGGEQLAEDPEDAAEALFDLVFRGLAADHAA